jgi:hypothetical protein
VTNYPNATGRHRDVHRRILLGHVSPAITATIYSHALKGSDAKVAQALDTALGFGHRPENEDSF